MGKSMGHAEESQVATLQNRAKANPTGSVVDILFFDHFEDYSESKRYKILSRSFRQHEQDSVKTLEHAEGPHVAILQKVNIDENGIEP